MSDLKRVFKGLPKKFWLIIIIVVIAICALPALFTSLPSIIDFTETGQIGDTIGGVMGPFIAIVAALLTFFAFWVQFDANRELANENRRNHFESRFYKMLDIHLENVAILNKSTKDKGLDSCFHVWYYEILNLFNLLKVQGDFGGFVDSIKNDYKDEPTQEGFLSFLDRIQSSNTEYQKVIFEIAYSYFYEKNFSTLRYGDNKETFYVVQFASLFTTYLTEVLKKEISGEQKNELLGRYYRHLFQIVKYVDGQADDLFEEKNWKKEYVSLLRSQMSDYEQFMLYYNAQSSYGRDWDENHYIENYRMIKNIPHLEKAFSSGIPPIERYYQVIEDLEAKGENFFER